MGRSRKPLYGQLYRGFESLSLRQTTPVSALANAMASFGWPTPIMINMWFVYILKSVDTNFIYIGSTNDIARRLNEHNDGLSQSTKHYRPYEIAAYIAVKTEEKARKLEKYFKTGSGKAALKKRILTDEALA